MNRKDNVEEKMVRVLKAAAAIAATFVIATKLVSWSFALMNKESDVMVGIGFLMFIITVAGVGVLGWTFGRPHFMQLARYLRAAGLLAIAVLITGCAGCTVVNPGYVGIKVNMVGSDRGVQDIPVVTGWVFYNPFTQRVYEYPTFVQTAQWTKDPHEGSPQNEEVSFNSKEGMLMQADISLSYQLDGAKVPSFYVKFRSDDLNHFTHGFLRNIARDAFNEVAGKYEVEVIYGPKKEEVVAKVRERINAEVADIGISLQQFGFIGAPRPPQNVIDAINSKIAATQNAMRAENELRQTQAEAQKFVAKAEGEARAAIARAEGEAKANLVLAQSITRPLLEWRQLQITEQAVAKWDGRRPTVEGQGGGLLLQIPLPESGK